LRLKEVLFYNPKTGDFTWLVSRGKAVAGSKAGSYRDGYIQIGVDDELFLAHILAWFWMTKQWPETFLDHKDNNRSNNTWLNLREATRSQNNANCGVRSHSATGIKGVQMHRSGRFMAKITVDKKQIYLGIFDTAVEAGDAYAKAAILHRGEFARVK
jgi:hypothetical protein